MEVKNNELYFAKVKEGAITPTKETHNMGYDVYACFDEEYMLIPSHTTKMIPTGIATAVSEDYGIILKERGSTGTKGIAQRSGVVDSSYRGEIFAPITNTNDKPIIIVKDSFSPEALGQDFIVYPYTKAICQALILPVPKMKVEEISYEELITISSERGTGMLGSSGK